MKKLRLLLADLHAGSMDLAVGVFLITALTALFHIPFAWWHILLGAALTVLPDFDIFLPLLKRITSGTVIKGDHHKTWLHFPALMLPIVGVAGYVLGGWQWAVIATLGVLAHYIHDAITIENGGRFWLIRTRRTEWKYSSGPTTGAEEWMERNWLQWSRLSVIETLIAALALLGALAIIVLR